MAKGRKTSDKKRGITREQIWKIWEVVTPRDWHDFFNHYKRALSIEFAGETTLRSLCPHPRHIDTTPSFYIFCGKGYAKCFGCGYYTSNPIELMAMVMGGTDADAVQYLNERYTLTFLPRKAIDELKAQKINQLTKQAIFRACHQLMCNAIATPGKYPYAQPAIDWLTQTRQVPVDTLHALPLGIVPSLVELSDIIDDNYKRDKKLWESSKEKVTLFPPENVTENSVMYMNEAYSKSFTLGGVLFPLHVTPSEIGRLKIREPSNTKEFYFVADDFEDLLGLYGLGWEPYQSMMDPKTMSDWAYITEGEMDVLSYMAHSLKNGFPNITLFSAGGTGASANIEPLFKAAGFSGTYLVGDAPYKGQSGGGDVVIANWLQRIRNLRTRVFTGWDKLAPAGDLDEAVLQQGIVKVDDCLWKKTDDHFVPAWSWAADLAVQEIDSLSSRDYRAMIETAATVGSCLRHRHDIEGYATALSGHYPELSAPIIKREMASNEDSETGFILRCTDALRDQFATIATKTEGGHRLLLVYAKKAKEYRKIKLDSEQSIAQELAPTTGNLLQFIRNQVGFPSFLDDPETIDGQGRKRIDANIRYYLKEACLDLAEGVPDMTATTSYRQGYHAIKQLDNTSREYIVCGKDVFKMDRTDGGDTLFTALGGPSDTGILFDLGLTNPQEDTLPWFPGGLNTKILNGAKDIDIHALYNDVYNYFNAGFDFQSHDVTCTLLAAQTLIFPVMSAFDRQMVMFITGETHSGKSHLMSTFCGVQHPRLRLVYGSHGQDNYTVAGVIGATNRDSRLICLDEFEFEGHKAEIARVIMEVIRGLVGEQTTRITGVKDGKGTRTTHHRMPVILAGITGAERTQDLNRLIILDMKKRTSRDSPENILLKEFGLSKIEEMARQIAVALFPKIPQVLEHYREVRQQFTALNAMLPFQVEWRYASALFAAMSLLKYLELDWKAFFRDFVALNSTRIHRATTMNESANLIGTMFNHGALYMHDTKRKVSVASLLSQSTTRNEVNTQGCGVYFDESTKYVMVLLSQAMPVLIPPNHPMRNATETRVRDTLERHTLALSPKEIRESGIIKRSAPFLGSNITTDDVVAFRAYPWLNEDSGTAAADAANKVDYKVSVEDEQKLAEYDDWG